jgi:hypothetical protein
VSSEQSVRSSVVRRRYRANGHLESMSKQSGMLLRVQESFPNCPKYIQQRKVSGVNPRMNEPSVRASGTAHVLLDSNSCRSKAPS